ncbi:uncharacterized protein LOC143195741 [Rhynchophorus ferrugineus]|uniref:uncharacterized protein LOC143195741 n=1 Tax=Rhynchophorus ferrugineus TaxID=354439 RepID=UPI003FCD8B87
MDGLGSITSTTVWLVLLNNVILESVTWPSPMYTESELTREKSYCGSRLSNMLSELCLETFSPEEGQVDDKENRITEECCLNSCTLEKLLYYFCKTRNEKAIRRYIETGRLNVTDDEWETDKSARRKRRRRNRRRRRRNCKAQREHTAKEKRILSRPVPHYKIGYNELADNVPLVMPML